MLGIFHLSLLIFLDFVLYFLGDCFNSCLVVQNYDACVVDPWHDSDDGALEYSILDNLFFSFFPSVFICLQIVN